MLPTYSLTPEEKLLRHFQNVLTFQQDYLEALKIWTTNSLFTPLLKQKAILEVASLNHESKAKALSFLLELDPTLIEACVPDPFFESGNLLHVSIPNGWRMEVEKPAFEVLLKFGINLEFRKIGATEWQEESHFEGDWGIGGTPLLECAKAAQYQWIPMLLEAGANPEAVDDAGLNFLDTLRVWSGKIIQVPHDAEQTLEYWLTQEVGQKQMLLQMQNPEHLQVFLRHYPDLTREWLAKREQEQLQNTLPKTTKNLENRIHL